MVENLNICCLYNKQSEKATEAFYQINKHFNIDELNIEKVKKYNVIITLGGDGEMLRALHLTKNSKVKIFGMNLGSIGFLLNKYDIKDLLPRINNAQHIRLYPLKMVALTEENEKLNAHAFNEVSLLRETNQIAKIRIYVDDIIRMDCLYADGIIISTPAGSTAYNFAANGPIIPLNANVLALTPISPFRPRRWNGALIPDSSRVKFEILEFKKRPVSAVADSNEIRNIKAVEVFF